MHITLFVLGIILFFWLMSQLGKPWRRYHEKHIAPLKEAIAAAAAKRQEKLEELDQAKKDAALFHRDLSSESREQQAIKSEAYNRLEPIRERKTELHEKMAKVRSSLDSWHRSSKSFFGNKSRKIKDDSILGLLGMEQTMAQKNDLEKRRSTLGLEIQRRKVEMSEIYKNQIEPAKARLKEIYEDRDRLKALRKQGVSQAQQQKKITDLEWDIARIDDDIERLELSVQRATAAYSRS